MTTPSSTTRCTRFCVHELESFFSANFTLVNCGIQKPMVLAQRYRLTGTFLGQGAFGVVLEAEDLALGRRVALKVMPAAHRDGTAVFEHGEATNLARLNHPGILDIYELTMFTLTVGDRELVCACMVLPVIKAPNLREWVFLEEPDQQRKLAMLEKIGRAIQYAHERGVIHGDLKPEHILIEDDENPVLIDFGLSLRSGRPRHHLPPSQSTSLASRQNGKRRGTAPYMAPEAFQGSISRESDRFSFAMISWELLTGELPLDTERFSSEAQTDTNALDDAAIPSQVRDALRQDLAFYESHRTSRDHPIFAIMTASTLTLFEMLQEIARSTTGTLQRLHRGLGRILSLAGAPRHSGFLQSDDAPKLIHVRGESVPPSQRRGGVRH